MAKKHTVVKGDTLTELAQRYYGDASLYLVIASANKLPDPDVISVGEVLLIPSLGSKALRHKVVYGDTLTELAERYYGDASLYLVIASANKLPDPDVIDVGQVLIIPDITP